MADNQKQTEEKKMVKSITTDGKPKKQKEKYVTEAFGVTIVTNY